MPVVPTGGFYPDDVNDVTVRRATQETGWPFDVSGRISPVRETTTVM